MSELILQLILFSSFAVIVYLMAIAVPRVKDDELNAGSKVGILPLDRMDAFLNIWKEKILRRLRIYLLKAESSVSSRLQKNRNLYETERKKSPFSGIRGLKRTKTPEKSPEITDIEQP